MRPIFLLILGLLLLLPGDGFAVLPVFNDVDETSAWFNRILTIKKRGITMGCSFSPSLYCPEDYVTRGQAAVLVVRALYSAGYEGSNGNAEGFSNPPPILQRCAREPSAVPLDSEAP